MRASGASPAETDRESVPVRSTAERKPSAESLRSAFRRSGPRRTGTDSGPLLGVRPRVGGNVEMRPHEGSGIFRLATGLKRDKVVVSVNLRKTMKINDSQRSSNGDCALSSAVEHFLHTEGVAGSNPAARTIGEVRSKMGEVRRARIPASPFSLLPSHFSLFARTR